MKKIASVYTKTRLIALALFAAIVFCFAACKKDKIDMRVDNRFSTNTYPSSTTRIINLAGFNQVTANGKLLTDGVFHDPNGPDPNRITGTDFFPKNGLLGSSWQVPQTLFGAANSLQMKFGYVGVAAIAPTAFTMPAVSETYNKPMDYYLLPAAMAPSLPNYVAVERSAVQPAKPDYFKIRILNLTAPTNAILFSPVGSLENLAGPVTLTYADGSPVAAATSGVTTTQRVSDYVELPYGTYQFRVLTPDGRQIPGAAAADGTYRNIYPPTSSTAIIYNGAITNSRLTFAPINTFQPGGVYTIVVTPYSFNYDVSTSENRGGAFQNAFTVVTDLSAPANITYCRTQAVNALPGSEQVSFKINGQVLAGSLNFGESSAYTNYIQGDYTIEALNASGGVLASMKQTFRGSQNYTIWLYADAAGKNQLLLIPNDLSGISVSGVGSPQDASQNVSRRDYMFDKRLLNLSPDNPYITFTFDNGQPAMANLQPGVPNPGYPYVGFPGAFFNVGYQIMTYRSAPNVVPGTWAKDIDVLKSTSFIANPVLYSTPGRALPTHEPGIYTVALIGRSTNTAPAAEKAKLIIVKHNK